MAEVRQRFGRGAYNFAHKTCNRYLLGSHSNQGKSAIHASSLSAGVRLDDIQHGGLFGAENAPGRLTGGVSRDSYARATPLFDTVVNVSENKAVAEHYDYIGLYNECPRPDKVPGPAVDRNPPPYRSYAKFRKSPCTFRTARRLQSLGGRPLCWAPGQLVFGRAYSGNETRDEPLHRSKTGYYDILEVAPTATQAQIKTAYYKQSFVYHPDRNAGSEEATVRFSEISEAYTVLGNKALRRKYDRGLLSQADLVATVRPSGKDTAGGSAKQQTASRRSVMGADSRANVFDFDQFFKAHYSEQLQRERNLRVRKEEMLRKQQETLEEKKMGRMMEMGVVLMLAFAGAILASLKRG